MTILIILYIIIAVIIAIFMLGVSLSGSGQSPTFVKMCLGVLMYFGLGMLWGVFVIFIIIVAICNIFT